MTSSSNHLLIWRIDEPQVPLCDPKVRAPSVDLPPVPLYPSDLTLLPWDIERDGIFAEHTFYIFIGVAIVLLLLSDSVKRLEQSMFSYSRRYLSQDTFLKILNALFFLAVIGNPIHHNSYHQLFSVCLYSRLLHSLIL